MISSLTSLLGVASAFAQGVTIYNSIPTPLPGNLASQPFQAQQASEVGDRIQFAGTARSVIKVTQTMSSWGCENGNWYSSDCVTTPGATFSHPITLKIYNVGAGNQPGSLIGSVTQTFAIPFRPTADLVNCTGGRWREPSTGNCYNGYATNITFNVAGLTVPSQVIYGIAYNTSGYGYAPIGYATACSASPQGCGYDSLNVALEGVVSVGTNPAPNDAYFNSLTAGNYCDGGAGGIGTFRLDPGAGCWIGFKPAVKFNAAGPAINEDQCKNGGWQNYTRADGSVFKNQGDCIQFVNTGN